MPLDLYMLQTNKTQPDSFQYAVATYVYIATFLMTLQNHMLFLVAIAS